MIETVQAELEGLRPELIGLVRIVLKAVKEINHSDLGLALIAERPTFRLKSAESAYEKLLRKRIPIEQMARSLKDLVGVRLVCQDLGRVERLIEALHGSSALQVVEEKRWIEKADVDGYRGVHLIVQCVSHTMVKAEIQVRTIAQHFWAGFSHRDVYKTGRVLTNATQERLKDLSDSLYQQDREVVRLESDIKADPLLLDEATVQSLLRTYFDVSLSPSEVEKLTTLIRQWAPMLRLPDAHQALATAWSQPDWITEMYRVVTGGPPTKVEFVDASLFAFTYGLYWPRRRLCERLLGSVSERWSATLGNQEPRDLLTVLEASKCGEVLRLIFTWQDTDSRTMVWSPVIDNRYTVKRLEGLGLIEAEFQGALEIRERSSGGFQAKSAYRVRCTDKGHAVAAQCRTGASHFCGAGS